MRYFYQAGRSTLPGNYPVLQETVLGWTVCGRTPAAIQNGSQSTHLSREDNSLKSNLNHFSEVEAVEQSTMTAEQQAFEKLPTKMEPNQLATSLLSSERRPHAIECKLERDPELKVQYHNCTRKF